MASTVLALFALAGASAGELGAFSPDLALRLAHFAHVGYCDQGAIQDWTCGPCAEASPHFEVSLVVLKTSIQVFVGMDGGDVIVSFRGSKDIQDFKSSEDRISSR